MINGISAGYNNSYYGNNFAINRDLTQRVGETGKTGKTECQTCKSRKYVDGSDEGNVSFKTPGHISPQSSAAVVASHEREHVKNAVSEGNEKGKELLNVSVSLKTSVCPECGKSYVSGGTTRTTMKTTLDETPTNPYNRGERLVNRYLMQGRNVDVAV